jgi:hypothetical protein
MSGENEKVFRTKTGFCHILPDRIVLTRDGVVGDMAKVVVGDNINRILLIYSALSAILFYSAFNSYKNGQTFGLVFFSCAGIFLIFGILRSLNYSTTPVIERNRIRNVKFRRAAGGLTRASFEITFENENGKLKKRLIMLPGSLSDGQDETEKALNMMRDEKLLP